MILLYFDLRDGVQLQMGCIADELFQPADHDGVEFLSRHFGGTPMRAFLRYGLSTVGSHPEDRQRCSTLMQDTRLGQK
jgi:hypothetical protein